MTSIRNRDYNGWNNTVRDSAVIHEDKCRFLFGRRSKSLDFEHRACDRCVKSLPSGEPIRTCFSVRLASDRGQGRSVRAFGGQANGAGHDEIGRDQGFLITSRRTGYLSFLAIAYGCNIIVGQTLDPIYLIFVSPTAFGFALRLNQATSPLFSTARPHFEMSSGWQTSVRSFALQTP
jgi:hypothetical protein